MKKRNLWMGVGAVAVLLMGGGAYMASRPKAVVEWRRAKVEKGNLVQRISATGTVSAMVQVPVGTQVSGVISALYADYNSLVKKGQLIAQIDPTLAEAQLRDAQAALDRTVTNMEDAKRQFERAKRLAEEKLLSGQDLDAREVAYKASRASVESAKATLERASANRRYCDITAPVDGVVIARMADVGQTVAASFSTPNLFQIAQDLSKMKVEISIDEADIGAVKVGQKAQFTVDSLPDKPFEARVSQVRLEPIVSQNVVSYKVVIEVDNEPLPGSGGPRGAMGSGKAGGEGAPDFDAIWEKRKERILERNPEMTKEAWIKQAKARVAEEANPPKIQPMTGLNREAAARIPGGVAHLGGPVFSGNLSLRPGMTANVTIITQQREDVFKVPNVALRFNPEMFNGEKKEEPQARLGQPMMMRRPPSNNRNNADQGQKGHSPRREDRIWIMENGKPKALSVRAGVSDGRFTEVRGDEVKEGLEVLTGVDDKKTPGGNRS